MKIGSDLGKLVFQADRDLPDTLHACQHLRYVMFLQQKGGMQEVHLVFKEDIDLREMVRTSCI